VIFAAHSKDQDGAGAIKAFDTRIAQSNESTAPQEDVSREKSPDLNTDDDTIPATMSRQIGSIALQNASAATPISATAVQMNGDDEGRKDDGDGRRVVNGAGGGSVGSSKGGGGRVRAKGSESDGFSAPLGSVGSDDDRFFFSEEDDRCKSCKPGATLRVRTRVMCTRLHTDTRTHSLYFLARANTLKRPGMTP